jgi:hypothetical protein
MMSAAEASPSAILRFSSARASLTALARSSARSRCGAGVIVAVSLIWCFASSHSVRRGGHMFLTDGQGLARPPPVGPRSAQLLFPHAETRGSCTPISGLSLRYRPLLCSAVWVERRYDIGASNSNVTSAAHALRARFFWSRIPCASVDKARGRSAPWPMRVAHPERSPEDRGAVLRGFTRGPGAGRARSRSSAWPRRRSRAPGRAWRDRAWPSRSCAATHPRAAPPDGARR